MTKFTLFNYLHKWVLCFCILSFLSLVRLVVRSLYLANDELLKTKLKEVSAEMELLTTELKEFSAEMKLQQAELNKVSAKMKLLKTKQKEVSAMQDKGLCMENVVERTKRESENSKQFAIQCLLDAADNVGRAASVVKDSFSKIDQTEDSVEAVPLLKTLHEGVEMTDKQLAEEEQMGESMQGGTYALLNLPDGVLNSILIRLPIEDAVRTSILSRKWRYKWASISEIVFINRSPSYSKQVIDRERIVDRVLSHHVGPINKFRCDAYVPSSNHIDTWIFNLSTKGIKELLLTFISGVRYSLPSSLFDCQELVTLCLYRCTLKPPPTFKGFPVLRRLNLVYFEDSNDDLGLLLSKCPLLNTLELREVNVGYLRIHAPNLSCIIIDGAFKGISFESCDLLASAEFCLRSSFGEARDANRERGNTYNLIRPLGCLPGEARDANRERGNTYNLIRALGCLPNIRRLTVGGYFFEFLCVERVPESLCSTFNLIEYLNLFIDFANPAEMSATLLFCRSAPKLKKLVISFKPCEKEDPMFWKLQGQPDCCFNQLQEARINGIYGGSNDLQLVGYILANAPVLETMGIWIDIYIMDEKRMMIYEKLMEFRRASTKAQLKCTRGMCK